VRRTLPYVKFTPRARADLEDCVRFIKQFPRGKANERKRDIVRGLHEIRNAPYLRRVEARRPGKHIDLRRHFAAQFAIIYAYFESDAEYPYGLISIRAIRHQRIRNVFTGVQEPGLRSGGGLVIN
jgi:plasmid stabilization system protein ParE